ncbi:MAG: hypothetical protein Ct9H300mP27_07090 [Chloroflexota bacterium]|nr:MAG: hypothetical protein Ct9H300mP27_07090 [Chloroflexota bacterium]
MQPTFEIDFSLVSSIVKIQLPQVEATAKLLAEGCTLPFIARYRKEATGGLDEIDIWKIQEEIGLQQRLNHRKLSVYKSFERPWGYDKVAQGLDNLHRYRR